MWWEWSHVSSCMVGSCIHVAVCDLNEHWWSDRRNLVSVPLWKWCRSSPICLRDWPPPAVLGMERLLGLVQTPSTLVCLDSSLSRRYSCHPRGLCTNYQHTGCLFCPILLSWVIFLLFPVRMLQISVMSVQILLLEFIRFQCFWPPLPVGTPRTV